jgi:phosphatidyl-myo-inositol dimannoside synthase
MSQPIRILVTAFDFRPRLGGVATCGFELSRALGSLPGVEVRVLAPIGSAGDVAQDGHGYFSTVRRWLPRSATAAVVPLAFHMTREAFSWRPDAVLNMLWQPEGVASLLSIPIRGPAGIPYFVLAHGVEVIEARGTLKKRLRGSLSSVKKAVFRNARAVFAVSHFTRDLLVEVSGVRPDRIRVVFNGVNPEEFLPGPPPSDLVQRFGLRGKKVFLTVTRFDDYKGIDRTIGALRYVVARHPEVVYLVCGTGQDLPRLQALVRRFGLDQHVVFAGVVPPGRLVDYYNLADCFVLVSRDDRVTPNFEGFGIVFLEAASCGKPSIAGRSGGIPDAVADGESGWLVNPDDEHEISRIMIECLRNPEMVAARGKAARERVVRSFTWTHMARRVLDEVAKHVRH